MRSNGSRSRLPRLPSSCCCIGKKWTNSIVDKVNRSRLMLVAIVLVFAAPLIAALLLTRGGWRPEKTRNYGTLLQPPIDVSAVPVALAGGGTLDRRDRQWHWSLLAFSSGECGEPCRTR